MFIDARFRGTGTAPRDTGVRGAAPLLSLRDAVVRTSAAARDERRGDAGCELLRVPRLDLFPGDRVVVTGPSGSGKSLLLSTLTGRWPVGVRFTGERTASFTRLGFVPQRGLDALHPLIPLQRQLRRVTGAPPHRIAQALRAVGLGDPDLPRRRPTELSGGQAQRAAVALAALTGAPILLADEPTSALDHDSRDQTVELLRRIAGPEQALVVATHDFAVAEALATRWLAVRDGVVAERPVNASGASEAFAPTAPAPRKAS
ncbi:ATP-binding cassette domain-containing protein [Leucobacter sp. CSA1]|uniref:ATP-binding cassette domain-containing protein n=1 Tax=Leucobacter chromiisoli TaxID=2796471 RepID=A0A934Q347_9MICO|nr:ATP-binding cassette domain-containing protein [Leucobacter chromiisoli]MBK0417645.1 ATP-binding cassette domain-containing protein [Leucobacter chromiisoli]